jgi:hypothetical protein
MRVHIAVEVETKLPLLNKSLLTLPYQRYVQYKNNSHQYITTQR